MLHNPFHKFLFPDRLTYGRGHRPDVTRLLFHPHFPLPPTTKTTFHRPPPPNSSISRRNTHSDSRTSCVASATSVCRVWRAPSRCAFSARTPFSTCTGRTWYNTAGLPPPSTSRGSTTARSRAPRSVERQRTTVRRGPGPARPRRTRLRRRTCVRLNVETTNYAG